MCGDDLAVLDLPALVELDVAQHSAVVRAQQQGAVVGLEAFLKELCSHDVRDCGSGDLHTLASHMSSGSLVVRGCETLPVRSRSRGIGRAEILPKGHDAAETARLGDASD